LDWDQEIRGREGNGARPTGRCSEREPDVSPREESNVIDGWVQGEKAPKTTKAVGRFAARHQTMSHDTTTPRAAYSADTAKVGIGFGSALAITISWSANKSIFWAILHGVFSWFYVV
jgi:hypothetical protein